MTRLGQVLATAIGGLLVFYPFGGALAAGYMASSRWVHRRDAIVPVLVALGVLALWVLPDLMRGDFAHAGRAGIMVAPMLLLAVIPLRPVRLEAYLSGIALGLSAVALLGWLQASGTLYSLGLPPPWDGQSARGRAYLWFGHPNLMATAVMAAAVVACSGRRSMWVLTFLAAMAAVLFTGSRGGVLALVLLVAVHLVRIPLRQRLAAVVIAALAVSVALVAAPGWFARFVPIDLQSGANVLAASEDLGIGPWRNVGVRVEEARRSRLFGQVPATFLVTKTEPAWWSRSQQIVMLPAGSHWLLTFDVSAEALVRPGFHGTAVGGGAGALTVHMDEAGTWGASAARPLRLDAVRTTRLAGGWTRVSVTFNVTANASASLAIGPMPDVRPGEVGAVVRFRRIALQPSQEAPSYVPTYFRSVDARVSPGRLGDRLDYMRIAVQAVVERPWFGHGDASFTSLAISELGLPITHPHNQLVAVAYARGVFGLAALIVGLVWFVRVRSPIVVKWRWLAVIGGLSVLDATLLASGVLSICVWHLRVSDGVEQRAVWSRGTLPE